MKQLCYPVIVTQLQLLPWGIPSKSASSLSLQLLLTSERLKEPALISLEALAFSSAFLKTRKELWKAVLGVSRAWPSGGGDQTPPKDKDTLAKSLNMPCP